jgi:hypothetical protein
MIWSQILHRFLGVKINKKMKMQIPRKINHLNNNKLILQNFQIKIKNKKNLKRMTLCNNHL